MKNRTLFFVTIFSMILIAGLSSCVSKSGEKQPTDVCVEHKGVIEAMDKEIADLRLQVQNLEEEKLHEKPIKILTDNFGYYKFNGTTGELGKKFYKIVSLTVFSDPIIIEGVEGDTGGQAVEFILESLEPEPVRIVGSKTYYYDEKGNSRIPSKIKMGNQITLDDFFEGEEGG